MLLYTQLLLVTEDKMKLITELYEDLEYLSEAKEDGSKNHYIRGIFMQAEVPNRNGRIYKLPILEAAVNNYIDTHIKNNRGYGELGHPAGPQINLDRVSHLITELKQDGNNFIGKAKLTDTPSGNIAKGLLNSGANLGVSSRGMGSLKPNKQGIMEVQDDFHLATAADIVADPSAPNAFVKGVMENVDWVYNASNDSWYQEKLYETRKQLKRMKMDDIEKNKFGIFESFITNLSSKNRII
jgi:Prohead core protein serine protease